ncbi:MULTISPECIES: hypothetical protein [unclassified Bacillus (in: firmicutes)]|uniref:hypothetical protein n=1 Tax=unclassified Bacillus (in: firmicutes) TaxID=185979 RepID=UPI0008DF4A63|nr:MULTISPECIES: hypothetical protein [unclassified Bacillus (in: firmicutes)]SFA99824.1 hypothetical protein SAMN02799634_103474 [Bacillus sp. UNCCL13]SFQ81816.1 hypothetical protein SAMN04488577_2105 [Bacillus sp. cl95]
MNKKKLIELLLDEQVDDATRDDCAIYLADFDDEEVISVLINVANNKNEEEMIRATCGESLAEIWIRKNQINFDVLANLEESALEEALGLIKHKNPQWYMEYEKHNK